MDYTNIFNENTILNRVITDLQPIIQEYIRTFPLFVIGKYDTQYPDYRIINKNDGDNNKFMNALANYYNQYNGLPSIDSFEGAVLCSYDCVFFHHNAFFVRCTKSQEYNFDDMIFIKLGDIIPFFSGFYSDWSSKNIFKDMSKISLVHCEDISRNIRIMGLYVKNDSAF